MDCPYKIKTERTHFNEGEVGDEMRLKISE